MPFMNKKSNVLRKQIILKNYINVGREEKSVFLGLQLDSNY
jgi:hypothetical protein